LQKRETELQHKNVAAFADISFSALLLADVT